MKKNLLLASFAAAAGAIILLPACSQKSADTTESDSAISDFEIKQTIKSLRRSYLAEGENAVFGDSMKIYSTVNLEIEWPEAFGDYDISVLRDSLLAFAFEHPEATVDASMKADAARPEGTELFTMTPVDSIPNAPCMEYTRDISTSVVSVSRDYTVYQVTTYSYTGGAHGATLVRYVNYDFDTSTVADKANTFTEGSDSLLLPAITSQLCSDFRVNSPAALRSVGINVDDLTVSPNFYFDDYEIVFVYNQYEIAPYALGIIKVRVPFFAIADALTPLAKSILGGNAL